MKFTWATPLLSLFLMFDGSLQLQASQQNDKISIIDVKIRWNRAYRSQELDNIENKTRVRFDATKNTQYTCDTLPEISEDEQNEQTLSNNHRSKKLRSESDDPDDVAARNLEQIVLDTIKFREEAQTRVRAKKQQEEKNSL